MKPAAVIVAAALLSVARSAPAQEAIYVVRHAERADQTADSSLSTAGVGRAYRLRDMLEAAGITKIFTSELKRTIETAAPLAKERRLTPRLASPADADALAAAIAASSSPTDRVLVVGHSNTVPALLRALHVDETITIGDDDYDNLFVVIPQKAGRPVLLKLKY